MTVQWCSPTPTNCDICDGSISDTFYDAATDYGPWGIMCPMCFKGHGRGLGLGKGQEYRRSDDKFIKVRG